MDARRLVEMQRVCEEAIVWKHIPCSDILRPIGVFYHNGAPAIVTPWMSNGTITEYLEKHPDADRFHLVGFPSTTRHFTSHLVTFSFHT
jgi:hypothetical protein